MVVAGPDQGLDRGFDRFEVLHDARARVLTERALEWARSGPSFLWVHYADPHFPYLPEEDVPAGAACRPLAAAAESGELARVELFVDAHGQATAVRDACAALYDAEVTAVDTAIGTLIENLPAQAWVVFSADHGEHLGEGGLFFEHGPTVHGANLDVPLVIAGPGVSPGRDDSLAQLTDLAATTLDIAALPTDGLDGVSLLPRLRGLDTPVRDVASGRSGSALQPRLTSSVVSGRGRKWCLNGPRWSWCQRKRAYTLHDRTTDPLLERDLAAAHPDIAAAMASAASAWKAEGAPERYAMDATHKLVARPSLTGAYSVHLYAADDRAEEADLAATLPDVVERLRPALMEGLPVPDRSTRSPEELEHLRALGYVE